MTTTIAVLIGSFFGAVIADLVLDLKDALLDRWEERKTAETVKGMRNTYTIHDEGHFHINMTDATKDILKPLRDAIESMKYVRLNHSNKDQKDEDRGV